MNSNNEPLKTQTAADSLNNDGDSDKDHESPGNKAIIDWLQRMRDGFPLSGEAPNAKAKEILNLISNGLLRVGRPLRDDAYFGDAYLDLYVAWEGIKLGFSANNMDYLRRTILSNNSMGGEESATEFEGEVSRCLQTWTKAELDEMARRVSRLAMPGGSQSETLSERFTAHARKKGKGKWSNFISTEREDQTGNGDENEWKGGEGKGKGKGEWTEQKGKWTKQKGKWTDQKRKWTEQNGKWTEQKGKWREKRGECTEQKGKGEEEHLGDEMW